MMISDYRLEQNLPYDLTRPVAEMAAFFDILPQSDSTDVLKIVQEADGCVAILQTEDGTRRVSRQFTILQDVRGCLLYTSDAADDLLCGELGGRRIIQKKN